MKVPLDFAQSMSFTSSEALTNDFIESYSLHAILGSFTQCS